MGAGILPTAIYHNKLYFLFGKENKYEDSASGFSDFGGGQDHNESFLHTAIREGTEELTGFLGSENDLRKMLKKYGNYPIDYNSEGYSTYRTHLFPFPYDEKITYYYNNNQRFLQTHLDPMIIQKSKIFEKEEIRWVCIDDILKLKSKFRSYFQNIIEIIYRNREDIYIFMSRAFHEKQNKNIRGTRKNKKIKK